MAEQIVAPVSASSRSGRGAGTRQRWWLPLLLVLGAALLVGCGSSKDETSLDESAAAAPTSTPSTEAGSGTTYMMGKCTFRMPGEVLTADEAVVWFSTDHVCPGYVTIAPGTAVTFTNEDTATHSVSIAEGAMPGGAEIDKGSIEPGQTWVVDGFDAVGTFTYTTDAIPSFLGTIEVTDTPSHA